MSPTDAFGIAALTYYFQQIDPKQEIEPALLSPVDGLPGKDPMAEYFQTYEQMKPWYKEVLDYAARVCPAPKRVLDIGCGPGRFACFFQERGYDVLGIDPSPGMVWVSERYGARNVRRQDVAALSPAEVGLFDIILILGSNIGIGGSPPGVDQLLEKASCLAAAGALLLVNSKDVELDDSERSRNRVQYNKERGRYLGQTVYQIKFGPYVGESFDWIFVKHQDFGLWARQQGWQQVKLSQSVDPDFPGYWAGAFQKSTAPAKEIGSTDA